MKHTKRFKLNIVTVGTGADCPRCGRPMERRGHADGFIPPPQLKYYFAYWDWCSDCRHVQHYEEAKQYRDAPKKEKIGPASREDGLTTALRARLGVDQSTTIPTDPVAIGMLLRQLYGAEEREQIIEALR